jgi:HAD superfamily hydrolase (TIGR01490 family)
VQNNQDTPGTRIVAYFDFDGTLSKYDTFMALLCYCSSYWKLLLYLPQLLSIFMRYKIKSISTLTAKEHCLSLLLKNTRLVDFASKATEFLHKKIDKNLHAAVYARLEWHREHQHTVVIVSANLAPYLQIFATQHKIMHVIATELEVKDGIITGKFSTKNCSEGEKVHRIKEFLNLNALIFDYSFGYGNSRGDKELLDYVDEAYWVSAKQCIQLKR